MAMGNVDNPYNGFFIPVQRQPEHVDVQLKILSLLPTSVRFRYKGEKRGWLDCGNSDNSTGGSPEPNRRGKEHGKVGSRGKGQGSGRGQANNDDMNKQQETGGIQVKVDGMEQNPDVEVTIRCGIVSSRDNSKPHIHTLAYKENSGVRYRDFIEAVASSSNGWIATFPAQLAIIRTRTDEAADTLERKLTTLAEDQKLKLTKEELSQKAMELKSVLDPHSVCLKFEAFVGRQSIGRSECSEIISNSAREVKVVRNLTASGPSLGGNEIHLWVSGFKQSDTLEITFFEKNGETFNEWEGSKVENVKIVKHEGAALLFHAPPYRDTKIKIDAQVYFKVRRITDEAVSQAMPYIYLPCASGGSGRKRVRDSSQAPSVPLHVLPGTSKQDCTSPNVWQPSAGTETIHNQNFSYRNDGMEVNKNQNFSNGNGGTLMNSSQNYSYGNDETGTYASQNYGYQGDGTGMNESQNYGYEKNGTGMCQIENYDGAGIYQNQNYVYQGDGTGTNPNQNYGYQGDGTGTNQSQNYGDEYNFPVSTLQDLLEDSDDFFNFGTSCTADSIVESDSQETSRAVPVLNVKKELNSEDITVEEAVYENDSQALVRLLQKALVQATFDSEGNSLLHTSAGSRERFVCLEILLRNSAFAPLVNRKNHNGETALHWAVEAGCLESVRLLLEHGADPNLMEHRTGSTALHLAAAVRNQAIFDLVVREGGDLNAERFDGLTPRELFNNSDCTASSEEEEDVADLIPHLKLEDAVEETKPPIE